MGSLTKHQLGFSSSDLANSDQVGANVIAGGTVITATGTSMNVNITNASIPISATDLDIRDLDATQDNVAISDGTDTLAIENDGSLNVNLLDLVADDAVDAGGSLKVGSRALSTLGVVSASGDRADLISDLYRRIYVNNQPNIAGNMLAPTVSDTASQADATPLAGRKKVLVQNLSDKNIYLGTSNAVTISNGIEIPKKGNLEMSWGENIEIWLIGPTGISDDVRILELA
jgi:hypothetical protein